jgi:hypothetical protein
MTDFSMGIRASIGEVMGKESMMTKKTINALYNSSLKRSISVPFYRRPAAGNGHFSSP